MAKVSLAKHKEGFAGDQKDMGRGPDVRTGRYHLVNVELVRATTSNDKKKVRVVPFILAALDEENKDLEGSRFGMDFWCDLSKSASAKKWTYLIMAHGNDDMLDAFDPDDDALIVKAITGRPYYAEIEVMQRPYKDAQGVEKTSNDVEPKNFAVLTKEQKAVYNTPKWVEIVGKPEDRVKVAEKRENSGGGKGGAKGGKGTPENNGEPYSDPFADPQ